MTRALRRRLALGLPTLLGLSRRGFFLPHRYAGAWPARPREDAYPELAARFRAAEPAMRGLLEGFGRHAAALRAIGGSAAEAPPPEPRWRQSWFPRLDAAAAYVLLRERRPARLVEVGSGHSTRFFRRAAADGGFELAITAIDPAPRADIAALPITLHRRLLQETGPEPFAALAPGDVASIDSSHLLVPGSDVDLFFGRVLPRLPLGCLLHVHDIFLPDDYPEAWAWRGYNEQLALPPLLEGGAWAILWSSHWAATRMAGAVERSVAGALPLPEGAFETSLWLERVR